MRACPFCFKQLEPASSDGLAHEACAHCGALWVQGEPLEKVVGHSATDALLRQARGGPGQCKGCHQPVQFVPGCPHCGRDCPACPQCGERPLPVAELLGVKVDVCVRCRALGLQAGALEQLQEAARRERFLELELRPLLRQAPDTPLACASCQRVLQPRHSFASEGQAYCGSCAPSDAVPYDAQLTRAEPSLAPSAGSLLTSSVDTASQAVVNALSGGLARLFSKLLG